MRIGILHNIFLTFNLIISSIGLSEEKIPLDKGWTFSASQKKEWKKATVPGVVHLDLMDNGVIGDPYKGNNELKQRWIEHEDWVYRLTINTDSNLLKNKHIELVFEGLDTYATIFINGKELLFTDNMFCEWIIDVKPHLNLGENELIVLFHSPLNLNEKNVKNAPYELPAANENVELKVSPYTRKAAYHFGWDWGPRFVTCGIWRPVYLRTWNELRIENINYSHPTAEQNVKFTFEIDSDTAQICTLKLNNKAEEFRLKKGKNTLNQFIQIKNIKNWNPIGYGKQNFQNIPYSISIKNKVIISDQLKWANTKIELIQEKDSIGTSFYFNVNGQPFYAKGANYIPQDLFLPRVDSARYEKLIQQAVDANINMLRVWGGGIYESDYFYDLCDQNGILVWQDFMFANSMYPNDPEFIDNIRQEVEYNVKRLRNHPCIALWCGNNEIEVAWSNWGWQKQYGYSPKDSATIWHTYQSIFHELIPQTLEKLDPSRPYVPTTPLSNWGKSENFNHSSMHYWGVWHGREPIENYAKNVGRFIAEYGYQSYPDYETLAKVIEQKDLDLLSEVMKNRQKSYIGNGILEQNVIKYAYKENDFATWIQLSQLVQAHAYGLAIREHRTQTPHCMGTLFWQLNDCWPGPSWSVIDYYGNEKAAYGEVQHYYQPIIAKLTLDKNELKTTLVSDHLDPTEVHVTISAENRDGRTAPILKDVLTLNFLQPIDLYERIPRKLMRTLTKNKGFSHFYIEIKSDKKTLFKANYYPENQSTIQFPKTR